MRFGCGCRLRSVAAACAAAFGALAGLVASGALNGLDQWCVDHAMPFGGGSSASPTVVESVVPLLHAEFHPFGAAVAQVVTLPGQVVISSLLVLAAAWKLRNALWIAAWLFAVAAELVFRHALMRPELHRDGVHLVAFDTSWPSGHALRSALVVAALAAAWPALRIPLALWLVAVAVLLELAGFHTPTDIAGGLILAAVVTAGAVELERSGLLGRWAALRRSRARPTS
jgi:membrane-associated phospholipid phosphatase